ncbi:MAG: type II toxin-antitoxin system HicA family toxin [Planctomycetes bacterium]|nr:type II toxin-antitoxin system HicA family toxin [Planctomycetota bacterium]
MTNLYINLTLITNELQKKKIIRALKEYGFELLREGRNHSIYTNNKINIPVGRHKEIDRDTAILIAKEIGIEWNNFKNIIS